MRFEGLQGGSSHVGLDQIFPAELNEPKWFPNTKEVFFPNAQFKHQLILTLKDLFKRVEVCHEDSVTFMTPLLVYGSGEDAEAIDHHNGRDDINHPSTLQECT